MSRRYTCQDCKFWNEANMMEASAMGECRHQPPVGHPRSWPITFATDWCGRIEVNLSASLPPPPPPPPPPRPVRSDYPLPPEGMPRRMSLSLEGIEPPVTPMTEEEEAAMEAGLKG